MTISLLQLLYALVLLQATVYGLYVTVRRFPVGLSIFLLGLALHMVLNLAYEWSWFGNGVDYSFGWASLYGPAFYVYLRAMSLHPISRRWGWLHFVVFALINLLNIAGFVGDWLGPVVAIQLLLYVSASAVHLWQAYRSLPHEQSEPVAALLMHTRFMLGLFVAVVGYDAWARSQPNLPVLLGLSLPEITLFGVLVLINTMFLRQLSVPTVPLLSPVSPFNAHSVSVAPGQSDSRDDADADADADAAQVLVEQVAERALFTTPNLTIGRLAEALSLSERRCSELLNQQLQVSFSDFINQLRVDACQNALVEKPERTVLEIGLANGFNSKTSFNAAFKKFTGQTPTQFRKSARSDSR
jgi:AraC-like DNA-binding protein